jgi:hypothetical protein
MVHKITCHAEAFVAEASLPLKDETLSVAEERSLRVT